MRAGRIAARFKIVELQVMWLGGGRGCGETVFLQKLADKLGRSAFHGPFYAEILKTLFYKCVHLKVNITQAGFILYTFILYLGFYSASKINYFFLWTPRIA